MPVVDKKKPQSFLFLEQNNWREKKRLFDPFPVVGGRVDRVNRRPLYLFFHHTTLLVDHDRNNQKE